MKRPGDPDLLWLYHAGRRETQEALALLVERAAAITRKAQREHRGPDDLAPAERTQISDLFRRASRLAVMLRETL